MLVRIRFVRSCEKAIEMFLGLRGALRRVQALVLCCLAVVRVFSPIGEYREAAGGGVLPRLERRSIAAPPPLFHATACQPRGLLVLFFR